MRIWTPIFCPPFWKKREKSHHRFWPPLNAVGDQEGCHFENGVIRTPTGFKDAFEQVKEGGWTGIDCDPEFGGSGPAPIWLERPLAKCLQALTWPLACIRA